MATIKKRLDRFEHLAKAYRVRLEDGQWLVKKVGGKRSFLPAKDEAVQAAKKKAAAERGRRDHLRRRTCLRGPLKGDSGFYQLSVRRSARSESFFPGTVQAS
ncbi:MAG: hypothetical protein JO308_10710 [Verrucomicrobia bacterium]|nr:hypothetical protein [Verrucomicrobiota bacterium]